MGEIVLPFVEGKKSLEASDIYYIESYRHKIIFHTAYGEYGIYKSLNEVKEMLGDEVFVRIHKSYIANISHVKSVSSYMLTLDDGTELPIPKGRYRIVKESFINSKL